MNYVVFDIETEALPIEEMVPFESTRPKLGNATKPETIEKKLKLLEESYYEKGALSPLTGRVLCIGVKDGVTSEYKIFEGEEKELLMEFWSYYSSNKLDVKWIGYNSDKFDWPFLIFRSIKNGVRHTVESYKNRPSHHSIDLSALWMNVFGEVQSLDLCCQQLGVKGKTGSGKHFSELYKTDKESAVNYLQNDLDITEELGVKLNVL